MVFLKQLLKCIRYVPELLTTHVAVYYNPVMKMTPSPWAAGFHKLVAHFAKTLLAWQRTFILMQH